MFGVDRLVPHQVGGVITSYSIHYTKLYDAQTELAQEFIRSTIHLPIPAEYQRRLSAEASPDSRPLLRLGFTGQTVDAPSYNFV